MSLLDWFTRREEEEEEEFERLVQHAAELHGVRPKEVVDTVFDEDEDDDEELEDDADQEEEVGRRWWRPGLWVTFVFVGIVFGVGISVLMWLAHQAAGPAASSGVAQFNASIAPTPAPNQTFESPLLMFSYPGVFNNIATESNWPNTSERYMIGSSGDYRRSISVMIETNAPEMRDDSGFEFRSEPSAGYTATNVTVSGTPAVVMVKSDGTERTLYWEHTGMLVIMSVVSTNVTDNISQYMNLITSTLHWRTTQ